MTVIKGRGSFAALEAVGFIVQAEENCDKLIGEESYGEEGKPKWWD